MSGPIQYGQYRVPTSDECVNFGVGQPAPSLLPLARVREAAAAKLAEEDPLLLQYGFISGYPAFRATLAGFLAKHYGRSVDADLLFVTNGISGGLALLTGALGIGAGDTVIVEEPSYFLALAIFRDAGLRIVSVKMDGEGLDTACVWALSRRAAHTRSHTARATPRAPPPTPSCRRARSPARCSELEAKLAGGLRPKLLYTIPSYQNPTSVILSDARRKHLVR